jgi:hypothetical protein
MSALGHQRTNYFHAANVRFVPLETLSLENKFRFHTTATENEAAMRGGGDTSTASGLNKGWVWGRGNALVSYSA